MIAMLCTSHLSLTKEQTSSIFRFAIGMYASYSKRTTFLPSKLSLVVPVLYNIIKILIHKSLTKMRVIQYSLLSCVVVYRFLKGTNGRTNNTVTVQLSYIKIVYINILQYQFKVLFFSKKMISEQEPLNWQNFDQKKSFILTPQVTNITNQ